ncbi:exported hypothetical protein [uncultured Alphaproteobacteria bacterium]|uniref:Uncharacterized protein n=1 Tax=uncultured Alphaproteobacteria bacterium TaxID=91750 RepID=A0A212KM17_9PROT|nr:exported hypothetical protein [uncultured Alphaproteobacteria bacterium]
MCELVSAATMTSVFGTAGATAGTAGYVGALTVMDVVGGLGALGSVAGMVQQGQAAQATANYQSKVAANQAKVAGYQAEDALARGDVAERQQRLQVRQLAGKQRAEMGASGAALDSSSFADTLGDTAEYGELDALTIRSNAEKEAWGYRTAAAGQQGQAALYSAQAGWASSSRPWEAGGSILTGFGTVADRWYRRSYA